jgi:hypothetical protein
VIVSRYLKSGVTIRVGSTSSAAARKRRSTPAHSPEERALIKFLDLYFPERRRSRREED